MENTMVRAIVTILGTVALAACAHPTNQVPAAQPEAEALRIFAPQPANRYPVGPEVLEFQNYGRTIADRVSRDPNFGGFIFKSEPEPHAIVMFTGNAEGRLRRYTRDPRFKAKRVDVTLAELEGMKSLTGDRLMALDIECLTVDADEEHNTVTVGAPPAELKKVRAAIIEGRFKPPLKFRLVPGSCVELR
jgi:hypothetical protein